MSHFETRPERPLPYSDEFLSAEEYADKLLEFAATSDLFRFLCGGVHILDFFTTEPGLFVAAVPNEWQDYLVQTEPMALLDFLMRDDLDAISSTSAPESPPESLVQ